MDRRCFRKATIECFVTFLFLAPIAIILNSSMYKGEDLIKKGIIDAMIYCLGAHFGFCCGFTFKKITEKFRFFLLTILLIVVVCLGISYLATKSFEYGSNIAFSFSLAFIVKVVNGREYRLKTDIDDNKDE